MDLEQRVQKIEERNLRVEADKAWEVSSFRVGSIVVATYAVAAGALLAIGNESAFRNALIPVIGYFLSTLSLPFIKRHWTARYTKSLSR